MRTPLVPAPVLARLARSEERWLRASADRLARRRRERLAARRDRARSEVGPEVRPDACEAGR